MKVYVSGKGTLMDALRKELEDSEWQLSESIEDAGLIVSSEILEILSSNQRIVDLYPIKEKSIPFYKEESIRFASIFPVFHGEFAYSEFYVVEKVSDEAIENFLDFLRKLGVVLKDVLWDDYVKLLDRSCAVFYLGSAFRDPFLIDHVSHLLSWEEEKESFLRRGKEVIANLSEGSTPEETPNIVSKVLAALRDPSNITEMRHKIRLIDFILLRFIEERMKVARDVAREKKKTDSPIDIRDIEEQKIKEILDRTDLNPVRMRRIFEEIMKLAKEEEYRLLGISRTVAVLGPMGSFSDEMAMKLIGSRIPLKYCSTTDEIIEMVEKGEVDYGIVPIENSTYGTVIPVLDALLNHEVEVFGEAKLEIHHCLVSKKKLDLKEIKRIYSHPQAISQSLGFINTYLSHAEIRYTSSTSDAVNLLDDESAAIMSESAAKMYGLLILRRSIQDLKEKNITRFYIIRRKTGKMEGKYTSLFFGVQDRPGSLKAVLDIFASRGINLRKLESRPARTFLGDYVFFVEVEAPLKEEDIRDLEKVTAFYKIIGVFDEVEELDVFK
ncbi:MAG: Prephenate dehydratase [Thermotoga sp. 47_83]|uniref:prephenate dehydratase n=1 Tax=Thermotoga sp. (strain RQ2) TaxID=126740 RepID=UPI0001601CE4|nr:prephenate dehydratase [Thermotoga sp. RQ2]ACB09146.1 Prephenate dehydratase [Thermotoga sp. RQ2]KUK33383.1 MAG: Prephenate dehydratase [Thermotoga sp. 47_83]